MKTDKQRDLFPGALEMMILRTLRRQPLHGYALVQQIKHASDDLLQIEEGSLYPALLDGLLPSGEPPKTIAALNSTGLRQPDERSSLAKKKTGIG